MTPPWWQPLSQRHFTRSRAHTRLEVVRQQMWQVFFFPFPLDNFLVSTDTRKGRISRYPNRIHTRLDTPQGCCFTCYAALLDTHQEHTQSHAIEFESEMDTRTQGSVAKKVSSFLFFYWRRRKKDVGFVACVCVCVENVSTWRPSLLKGPSRLVWCWRRRGMKRWRSALVVKTINCVCRKRARNCRARTPRLRGEKKEENEKRERITQKKGALSRLPTTGGSGGVSSGFDGRPVWLSVLRLGSNAHRLVYTVCVCRIERPRSRKRPDTPNHPLFRWVVVRSSILPLRAWCRPITTRQRPHFPSFSLRSFSLPPRSDARSDWP